LHANPGARGGKVETMGLDDADFAMVMTVCKGNKPQAFFWCGSGNRVMCQSVEGEMEHGSIP